MLTRSSPRWLAVGSLSSSRRWWRAWRLIMAVIQASAAANVCGIPQHHLCGSGAAPGLATGLLPAQGSCLPVRGMSCCTAVPPLHPCLWACLHCARPVLALVPTCIRAGLLLARLGVSQSLLARQLRLLWTASRWWGPLVTLDHGRYVPATSSMLKRHSGVRSAWLAAHSTRDGRES